MLAGVLALGIAIAGCGNKDEAESGESGVIRFAQAPDPVWEYMKDKGIIQRMEKESGIRFKVMNTFDYFALFAGGHADVISGNSYQTPLFDARGIPTVTFGKYNKSKDLLVAANPKWKSASDLPKGCKVTAERLTGNAIIWRALVKEIDGRDLAEKSDDLSFLTADVQVQPDLVAKGEACAAIADPTQIPGPLRTGKLHAMYDGETASQLFSEYVAPGHEGVETNDFVATKSWFDANPKEAAFFLEVWQRGLDLWQKNKDEIIETQPDGFGIQNKADEKFIKDFVHHQFDFFHDSVYLTPEFITGECKVVDLIRAAGVIPVDQPCPEAVVIDPKTGKVTETFGGDDEN